MEIEIYKKIISVDSEDKKNLSKIDNFLKKQDLNLDIIDECGIIYSEKKEIIGVICRYQNNLKCLAIDEYYQKNNFANTLITYMIEKIYQNGFNEVFVFTKPHFNFIFQNLGFDTIFENENFIFLTNRFDLFLKYKNYLKTKTIKNSNNGIIIINANPFTKGHEYLVEKALEQSHSLYIMVVKEEGSFFSYKQRLEMVKLGTQKFKNVIILEGSNYLISKNVFPSYFLPSKKEKIKQQTLLDTYIFINHIVKILNIKKRFVGEEPFSKTTNEYNKTMKNIFKKNNLEFIIFPRIKNKDKIISATTVRKFFISKKFNELYPLVPETTFNYLKKLDFKKYENNQNILQLVDKKH